jgi:hypothetical protein
VKVPSAVDMHDLQQRTKYLAVSRQMVLDDWPK